MSSRHVTDAQNDLGRQLTSDVATLALTLPVVAAGAFLQVVLPFVFVASVALVVLFATPFRDVPFIAQHADLQLNNLRVILLVLAFANLAWPGYTEIESLTLRWVIAAGVAVMSLAVITIDLRRTFPS